MKVKLMIWAEFSVLGSRSPGFPVLLGDTNSSLAAKNLGDSHAKRNRDCVLLCGFAPLREINNSSTMDIALPGAELRQSTKSEERSTKKIGYQPSLFVLRSSYFAFFSDLSREEGTMCTVDVIRNFVPQRT